MAVSLLDIVFPSSCVVCGMKPKPICPKCQPSAEFGELSKFDFPILYSHVFDGAIAKLLVGYKDQQLTSLEKFLISDTASLFGRQDFGEVSAVVVPARNQRNFQERGFDPARRLASKALSIEQIRVPVFNLANLRTRQDQRGLSRLERSENVTGSMALRSKIRGKVALFDDVMTTGSTVKEMARACGAAGVKVAFCCVLAQRFSDS